MVIVVILMNKFLAYLLSIGCFQEKHGPVGLIHVDAHSDTHDVMFGAKINHGTPFRRAVEEGCVDAKRTVQIGLRGTGYGVDDYKWGTDQVKSQNSSIRFIVCLILYSMMIIFMGGRMWDEKRSATIGKVLTNIQMWN